MTLDVIDGNASLDTLGQGKVNEVGRFPCNIILCGRLAQLFCFLDIEWSGSCQRRTYMIHIPLPPRSWREEARHL